MTIAAAGAAGVAPNHYESLEAGSLTPEALMLYLQSRLDHVDDQIKEMMQKQDTNREAAAGLTELAKTLGYQGNGIVAGADAAAQKRQIVNDLNYAISRFPPGHPQRARLEELRNQFVSTAYYSDGPVPPEVTAAFVRGEFPSDPLDALGAGPGTADKNNLSADEMKTFSKKVSDMQGELSKNAEMDMIALQSLMGKRQMAIQVVTDMMKKFNDGLMAIAANLK